MKIEVWSEQLFEVMLRADRKGAASLIEDMKKSGISAETILNGILDPVLHRFGGLWEQSCVSLAQSFVASKIAEDTLMSCLPKVGSSKGQGKGKIVLGNIEDDYHSLGRKMVATFLMAEGWEVHDLGNDVPPEDFVERALAIGASIIGISAMMHTTALNIRKVRDLIDARGLAGQLKLAVGGAIFNWRPELVNEVGGDGSVKNAAAVGALCQRLLQDIEGA